MSKISDNPKRQNRILFTVLWLGFPTYMFFTTNYSPFFLIFIIPGFYFLVYQGSKLRDIYVNNDFIEVKNHRKSTLVPIAEISSLTHYNKGVYKMCFKNKKLVGSYILFYGDKKGWFKKDGEFEYFFNKINT